MSDTAAVLAAADAGLMRNYGRVEGVVMDRGEGSRLWDTDGREYLDLFAGFGGSVLGHCHPDLVAAIREQAGRLWHVGNQFHTAPQTRLTQTLRRHAFDGRAFFCHGGADANEAAIKAARLRHDGRRWKTVVLTRAFHGRTLATLAATANEAYKAGFGPMTPGFDRVEPGDLDTLRAAVDGETAAVLMEPMQGEGGMHPLTPEYAAGVRAVCDEHELTLICDEVWTGCGRTGRMFAHQLLGIEPDVMTLGKAIGGGLPVGVCWARPGVAEHMVPGKHGSTLGGNPICAAAAATVLEVIDRDGLAGRAATLGRHAADRLRGMPRVTDVRGHGLFLGFEADGVDAAFAAAALDAGLVLNVTAGTVVRLAPALTIDDEQLDDGLSRIERLLEAM